MTDYNQQPNPQQGYQQPPQWSHPNLPFGMTPKTMRPSVGFKGAVRLWAKNLFTFRGRASQSEFWWVFGTFSLLYFVSFMVLYVLFFGLTFATISTMEHNGNSTEVPTPMIFLMVLVVVYGIVGLLGLLSMLALGWRRLQDAGFPGALWLLTFVNLGIVPIILAFFPSSPNGLRYEVGAVKS